MRGRACRGDAEGRWKAWPQSHGRSASNGRRGEGLHSSCHSSSALAKAVSCRSALRRSRLEVCGCRHHGPGGHRSLLARRAGAYRQSHAEPGAPQVDMRTDRGCAAAVLMRGYRRGMVCEACEAETPLTPGQLDRMEPTSGTSIPTGSARWTLTTAMHPLSRQWCDAESLADGSSQSKWLPAECPLAQHVSSRSPEDRSRSPHKPTRHRGVTSNIGSACWTTSRAVTKSLSKDPASTL